MLGNKLVLGLLLIVSPIITGCSTYPSKFRCGEAKGLGCTMLSVIDKQIDSGQIEEAYVDEAIYKDNICLHQQREGLTDLPEINKRHVTKIYWHNN